jgi:isoquinoline 1-oxidoreductase beta subunit
MSLVVKVSRRDFLKLTEAAGVGLVLGCYVPHGRGAAAQSPADPFQPNAFVAIAPDGTTTIWVPKSEMGQGVQTALPMIVAEELEADWTTVRVVQADLDKKYGDQTTGSSESVRGSYQPLRQTGAAARAMLIAAAAQRWSVDPTTCRAEKGTVVHASSQRRLGFGELAAAAARLPVPVEVTLKDPKAFTIVGTAAARTDTPLKVDGRATYGIDVKLPGMLYAVIARCPVFGGDVNTVDDTKARAIPGVRHVVRLSRVDIPDPFSNEPGGDGHQNYLPAGVAVVADSTWAAIRGRQALAIQWTEGEGAATSSATVRQELARVAATPGREVRKDGDVEQALAQAAKRLEAVYELPFQAHAPMEPVNCTAHVTAGGCEVWGPTQVPGGAAGAVAHVLKVPVEHVRVHVTYIGGGFGRRLCQDYAPVAALVSKAAGAPVQVLWTREDDIQHDYYRPASYHRMRAGLDATGAPVAWDYRLVTTSIGTFFGGPSARSAAADELRADDFPCHGVPNYRFEYSPAATVVPRGWWRSVEQSANVFAVQSFVDELAAAAGRDPVDFRLRMLGDGKKLPFGRQQVDFGRLKNVIQVAAKQSGWGTDPVRGRARGIAAQFSFGTYVAHVAEVSVAANGEVHVHRVFSAVDCGTVINPDIVKAQIESSVVFGLTATLKGEITITNGRVDQSNFDNYPMLRINEMPAVEVTIVPSTEAPGGMGEPGVPPVAPAVANAVFALTGKRIRTLPIRPNDLRRA